MSYKQLQKELREKEQLIGQLQKTEKYYSTLVNLLPVGIVSTDIQGKIIYINSELETMLGLSPTQIMGSQWQELIHPEDRDWVMGETRKLKPEKLKFQVDYRIVPPNKTVTWVHGQLVAEQNTKGEIIGYISTITDIGGGKRGEQQLQQTEKRLREAQRIANLGNWELDHQTNHLYWSTQTYKIFELDPQEVKMSYEVFLDSIHPDDRELLNNIYSKHLLDRDPYSIIHRLLMRDGRIKYVREQCETIYAEDGTPLKSQGTVQDVTEQRTAELEKEWAQKALRQIVEGTNTVTGENFFPKLVRYLSEILDVKYALVTELIGDELHALGFWADKAWQSPISYPIVDTPCENLFKNEEFYCETELATKFPRDPLLPEIQAQSYLGIALRDEQGQLIGTLCLLDVQPLSKSKKDQALPILKVLVARTITELRRYKLYKELETRVEQRTAQLREREARYRALMEGAGDAILIADFDGNLLEVNHQAEKLFGYDRKQLTQMKQSELHPPEDREKGVSAFRELVKGGSLQSFDISILRQDGQRVTVDISASIIDLEDKQIIHGIFRDTSERKQAEAALRKSENKFHRVFESNVVGMIFTKFDGEIIDANDCFLEMLGYTRADLEKYNLNWLNLTPPEYYGQDLELLACIQQNVPITPLEKAYYHKDGHLVHILLGVALVAQEENTCFCVVVDISDRKKSENALRESQQFLQTVLDSFPLAVFWKESNSVYLGCNQRFSDTAGLSSPREIINKTDLDFNYPEAQRRQWQADDQEIMSSGISRLGIEEMITIPTGENLWTESNKIALRDLTGNIVGIVGTFQDITPRKQAELALKAKTEELDGFFSLALDLLSIVNNDGYFIRLNRQWENILGYPLSELEQKHFINYVHPEDVEKTLKISSDLIQGEIVQGFINRYRCQDGTYRWLEWYSVCNGNVIYSVTRDITARVEAEAESLRQRERETLLKEITQRIRQSLDLQTIFNTACAEIAQVLQVDRVAIFKFYKDSNYNTEEFVAESVLPNFVSVLGVSIHDHCFGANYAALYSQGHYYVIDDIAVNGPTGCYGDILSHFQVQANLVMPLLCGNQLWGLLCIHQCSNKRHWEETEINLVKQLASQLAIAIQQANLFEQLQQEQQGLTTSNEQLAISNAELARATRLKDEFLANMSHELRTPLNAIMGMTEGLQEQIFGQINPQQSRALETIEHSSSHLLELINDILDVAKIESGQVELNRSYTSIPSLCQSSLSFIKQLALKKRIQLKTNIPANFPEIFIDERRIRQVLINLFNNAVKFTPSGGSVSLDVSLINLAKVDREQTYLRLAVIDTGIGIAPENTDKLFQPCVQIDSALNRQYQGTGLGLTLVKQLVELHGGQVGVISEVGVGSCFTIDLPVVQSNLSLSCTPYPDEQLHDFSGSDKKLFGRILLVEDNEANINTISSYLQAKGYQLLFAKNGQEAINLAKSAVPDLILMDVQMPEMDGLEAIKQIRSDPSLKELPIIALTALAMDQDGPLCLSAGADVYLSKPIKLKHLVTTIQQILSSRQEP